MEIDAENLRATELRLGPPGSDQSKKPCTIGAKRALNEESPAKSEALGIGPAENDRETAPIAKAQVVGWPPVRAYRKNTFEAKKEAELYVKVSMDGAPYLRKVDLKVCRGYRELREALDVMFNRFSSSDSSDSEFAIAYEDKDGDLMLVGDVPWDMFISSCKKLRIMRGSEAR